jgi:hypothetical protein
VGLNWGDCPPGAISVVVPVVRSRTYTPPPGDGGDTRSPAVLQNAIFVPSGLNVGRKAPSLPPSLPSALTDTSVLVPVARSRT